MSALALAACGTPASPAYLPTSTSPSNASSSIIDSSGVAAQPTATVIPPTETPVPPTATPTEEPTAEPTAEPTDEPAAEPTEETADAEAADSGQAAGPIDEAREADIEFFVSLASASEGDTLFHETLALSDGQVWACSNCHNVEEDVAGVGPSLIGINERAGSRVEGEGPLTYMYNSIYNSQAYLVPEFADQAQHMPIYGETGELTDQQIYNLIAYLQTLPSE
ncbi:MAG: hypothetical protein CL607_04855 [Anaerolineaceae bacterium]|nr:hypothetical protein [Anaerolineaceae bacterium]